MRRWRQLVATATLGGMLVAAAGCGVPSSTDVVVDGKGQADDMLGRVGGEQLPEGPEGTSNNTEEFVDRFLEAPAGDWEGAAERVKRFLSPQLQATWQAPQEITVVRLTDGKPDIKPAPSSEVVLKVQLVGVLTNQGTLEPPTSQTTTAEYTFKVGSAEQPRGGLAVTTPPPAMLLTDTALDRWYEQRPIYFWDTSQNNLIPDLRYLPRAVGENARPTMLIGWLLGGPAAWLRPSVLELPDGTKQLRNAYKEDGRLIVNLSGAAAGQTLDRLLAQLSWSLRADFSGDLTLLIEFQKRYEGKLSEFLDRNPTYRLTREVPQYFAVAAGSVRRLQLGATSVPEDVPLLDAAVNKNVRSAAMTNQYAALTRVDGDEVWLWVGPDQQGKFSRTSLHAASMSRPTLADGQDVGYVAAAGELYQFKLAEPGVAAVTVSGLSGAVTSVALAPDGKRLAVVAGGRPYVVALGGEGATATARPVPAPLTNLTAISWLSETGLAMAGMSGGQVKLARITMDGGVLTDVLQELRVPPVTQLVSFPEDPIVGVGGPIMVEAEKVAYQVFTTLQYVQAQEIAGPPVKGVAPTAPFFLE